ncbi:DNA-directed RNA polymerase III subunit RPC6 [Pichia kudriavzevii]|uniref:DNA-directed RNA polymerase III subunit RPC6 n=1 Tax=Pichia kudriavzevii TaxID=4909 RepID=A0A1V2LUF3_PICKU|nr:DNA-directed RNA polymerase III subunit RPC6 [Pichia kudriavzevii]
MVSNGKSSYTQQELIDLLKYENANELMENAQALLNKGLLKILESEPDPSSNSTEKTILFAPISEQEAQKVSSMTADEAIVYSHVEAADSELDTDFIDSLLIVIWKFVAQRTYPKCFKKKGLIPDGLKQYSYPANMIMGMGSLLPSLSEVNDFLVNSGITTIELTLSDVKSLCDVLEFDEKIECINGSYKATWQSILEAGGGKIEGEDIFAPLDNQVFNINDNYRVLDSSLNEEKENSEEGKVNKTLYFDSWITL